MQRPGDFPPIDFVPGDTIEFTLALKESDGTAHDLTGASIVAQVRTITGDDDPLLASFTVVGALDDSGTVTLRMPAATSLTLKGKTNLAWDLQVTYADATVRTLVFGLMHVMKDVSQ